MKSSPRFSRRAKSLFIYLTSLFEAFEILGVRQWGCSHVEAVLDGSIPAVELCSVEEAKAFA